MSGLPEDIAQDCWTAAEYLEDKQDEYLSKKELDALCESFRSTWMPFCRE